ncbi:MAG: Eco57I restriction-modification methylase domain-containing protein [Candidatus Nanoarchaeia archaeon]|nr:Eco57I restriction-modification methylase domain-containing protein [Candidatus Nanoarchaeia archaeon]
MEVQDILLGKEKLILYFKEKGFQQENEYYDDEYKEGSYFKVNKRKLLVIYEVFEEDKIKEIKDHFLIDRGLSYCVIILDGKLIFLRNFGETKHFIYSERTKNNVSKIDKLKNIYDIDLLFQSKDISALFYDGFKVKRNLLVQNIKNNVDPVQKYLIAQKIFDRFFFIYFLCHKDIIKFKNGGKLSGENLFTKILLKKGKFLENLQRLFHMFNSQEKNILEIDEYQIVIPYLNGGLFRPDVLEQDLDIKLKDEEWEEIFDFLNSYHWIIEDVKLTEEDEEKILTPEILGHVYERSVVEWESEGFEEEAENAVKKITERKKKGVYYTPESITDYISNNTIIPFLLDKLSNKYACFDELIESKSKKDMKDALKILNEIKILDPSCGSGAFLIKASEVVLSLKRRLNYEIKEKKNFYDMKLDIITENIYGVDILAGAIEISKLRLWLWLISDFEESKNEIKALPNIEYNLKVGNSLIGWLDEKLVQMPMNTPLTDKVDGIFTGLIAFSENDEGEELKKARELLRGYKLNDYIEAYYVLYKIYRRTHGLKAENLRSILEIIRKSIYSTVTPAFLEYVNTKIKPKYDKKNPPISQEKFLELQVFHWRIDFGHIILNGGFDIVIGNPPYVSAVRHSKDNSTERDIYRNLFNEVTGSFDLYAVFLLRGLGLTNEVKCYSWIIPNKFLIADYSKKILAKLISNGLSYSVDVSIFDVFKNVGVYPVVIISKRSSKDFKKYLIEDIKDLTENKFKELKNLRQFNTFEDFHIEIGSGTTGFQATQIKPLIFDTLQKTKNSIPFAVSGSIDPYFVDTSTVRYMGTTYNNPYIKFDSGILAQRKWNFWLNEKIVIAGMTKIIEAQYVKEPLALGVGCYAIFSFGNFNPKYLLGILNSKYLTYYINIKFKDKHLAGGYLAINKSTIEKLPLIKPDEESNLKIIKLVDEILLITKDKDYFENNQKHKKVKEIQDNIDQLVYKLYNLTPEEIKIVEDFCEKK